MVLPSPDSGIFLMKRDSPPASGLFLGLLRRPQAARALLGSTLPAPVPDSHPSSRVFGTGEHCVTGMTLFSLFAARFYCVFVSAFLPALLRREELKHPVYV